ncbi:PAS domain S-box protein [Aminobacter sp. BE322]|uniref:PAS domain S-box protein n=1 Tax=unclassified Aminobacter TaxID=2644704 RepID=UPI003D1E6062
MPSAAYSFIDVAVVDGVRQRFAAGDAVVVLSVDLEQVLWANGPGATVLGYDDVDAVIGAPARLGLAARRQIAATPGFPDIGRDRSIMVRVASGLSSRAVAFVASSVRLPDGEAGIMLAVPVAGGASRSAGEVAAAAISGFAAPGHFLAFVDIHGDVVAATDGFSGLGIARPTLAGLVAAVAGERDRMIKRAIPAAAGHVPAGIARLTDERHLLVVVDERAEVVEEAGDDHRDEAAPREEVPPRVPAAAPKEHPADHDHWYFSPEERESKAGLVVREMAAKTAATVPAPEETEKAEAAPATEARPIEPAAPEREDLAGRSTAPAADAGPVEPAVAERDELAGRSAAPVRFVWRTDAEGRFSAVSAEFVALVGEHAADVVGRRFEDVSNTFELDPSGEIAGLLQRRDTWSGRSVLWPVAGSDRRIPVDLAALPVYGRDRSFEGFRGFGVARPGEAVIDHERIGLALVPNGKPDREPEPQAGAEPAAPAREDMLPDQVSEAQQGGDMPSTLAGAGPDRSDKVIHLAEHRQTPAEPGNGKGLSSVERHAFREIGERLKRASEVVAARQQQDKAVDQPAVEQKNGEQNSAEIAAYSEAAAAETAERGGEVVNLSTLRPVDAEADRDTAAPERPEKPPLRAEDIIPREMFAGGRDMPMDAPILEQLPVPVLIHAGDMLHYANAEFLNLTGYGSVDELARAGGLDALFAESYGDEPGSDHDLRLKTRDGEEFPIEAVLRSVPWQDGKALMLVVRRISGDDEFDGASDQIAELEARLAEMRTIIDTATDGVVLIDRDGAIRSISRPAEALFGFDSDEVAGKPFHSLFAIESQRAARDYLSGLSEHGVASVLNDGREVIGREAQGRFIPLFMTIGRLPSDAGFCAVVRDITPWKRAEEELTQARAAAERSSSQKTDFLARISHEIRTPLNAIIGFSELMIDEKFGPVANDRYRDYLRDINRSGNHVLDLVNDLLDISKIEAGQQEMDYEAVSLNDTLAETVAMMQPQANRERVIIRSSLASRLPEVVADRRSVRQIALNILSNAVRYTQAGGQVIVSTAYETSGDIVMRVRDTGIGMSLAEIEQALKPFKQINSLKRARGDGTGLGLPLTKAMVEANRARFSIASTPGEGTLVEVTFPSTRVLAE